MCAQRRNVFLQGCEETKESLVYNSRHISVNKARRFILDTISNVLYING